MVPGASNFLIYTNGCGRHGRCHNAPNMICSSGCDCWSLRAALMPGDLGVGRLCRCRQNKAPRSQASCLNILMADAEPRLRLDHMQRCALISRKKNSSLTLRHQFASAHDTGAMQFSRGAADHRAFWRGVFANGRMGLLQNVRQGARAARGATGKAI